MSEKKDKFGEAEIRARMHVLYGENEKIDGFYEEELSAKCTNGIFVGINKDGIISYKGIPYAKPPVGDLRWKPSELPEADDGVYQAYYFGKSPVQTEWPSEEGSYYPQSEDCLKLNIWTADKNTKNAVMVFFHGGSYGWGGTSDPIYDGHNLIYAHRDVVLVTVEYRVGMMGFIDFSEVDGGDEFRESGNLGLLDHICALKWIKENISSFGGDPDNVTIFGESAGGGTVSLLPIMKQAKGLFRRSIAESGSVALTFSRDECKKLTEILLKKTGKKSMKELMSLTEEEIKTVNKELNDYNNFPERDGVVLPENLYEAYENGDASDVDMIIGTNSDEVRYWIREMGYYSSGFVGKLLFRIGAPVMYNNNLSKIKDSDKIHIVKYMTIFTHRKLWKIVEFFNDILFNVPASKQAELHAESGGNTYMYYWTYPSAHKNLGACHAVELAYVFNNLDVTIYTGKNIRPELASEVQNMWVNFAKTGNPSTELNVWEKYDKAERNTIILGQKIRMKKDPLSERRKCIEPLLKYGFNGCYTNLKLKLPPLYMIILVLLSIIGIIPALIMLIIGGIRKIFSKDDE